jgi:hypothetical protein
MLPQQPQRSITASDTGGREEGGQRLCGQRYAAEAKQEEDETRARQLNPHSQEKKSHQKLVAFSWI